MPAPTPQPLTERFADALQFAAQLHALQFRKGTEIPYISHLLSVCALVLEHGGGEDDAIAALLHDAVEDQGGQATLALIRTRYGTTVAELVWACTDADTEPKPPWRARKERYLEHLREAGPRARRVSCADKLHNARAILADYRVVGEAVWERFTGGKDGSLWYYRSLVQAFSGAERTPLGAEFRRVVEQLEQLAGRPDEQPSPQV